MEYRQNIYFILYNVFSSRQSLAGSRQSLSNMSVQSPNERASTPDSTNKRASFVEVKFCISYK